MATNQEQAKTILLVEDDDETRAILKTMLELDGGYRVVEACDGRTALAEAAHVRPDLVIMDLMLPDTSGINVTRQLRASEATKHIPIVALSDHVWRTDFYNEALAAGCDGCVEKNADFEALSQVIKHHLELGSRSG